MDKQADKPTSKSPADDRDFDKRHAKELGAARFAKIQATYLLVPLAAAAAGYALGHYAVAPAFAKMKPELAKTTSAGEVVAREALQGGKKAWKAIKQLGRPGARAEEELADFGLNTEQIAKIAGIWGNNNHSYANKVRMTAEEMKLDIPAVPSSFRLTSGAVTGGIGFVGGSIAIGYDQWRKQESARLAANEIDRDLSNMELFKKSDPELLAENKRLSEIVAKLPTPTVEAASVEQQGRVQDKQQNVSMA